MASPNDKKFHATLEREKQPELLEKTSAEGVRSPYDILEYYATHPKLKKYYKKNRRPFVLFGNKTLLISFNIDRIFKNYAGEKFEHLRFDFFENLVIDFDPIDSKDYCVASYKSGPKVENGGTRDGVLKKLFSEVESLSSVDKDTVHIWPIGKEVSVSFMTRDPSKQVFVVDEVLQRRSEIAAEVFDIISKVNQEGLRTCRQKAKPMLDDMVNPVLEEDWG